MLKSLLYSFFMALAIISIIYNTIQIRESQERSEKIVSEIEQAREQYQFFKYYNF